MTNLEFAKNELLTNDLCFIAKKGDDVIIENEYKAGALLAHVHNDKHCLSGAAVAANAVGRAEALLLVYAGIHEIYAKNITIPAVQVFRNRGVKVTYENLLDEVPAEKYPISAELEKKCLDIRSPFEAFGMLETIFASADEE
jgi:hypothetical protein